MKRKLAFCCPDYLTQPGGAQQHCRRLAEELSVLGHDVTVITNAPQNRSGTLTSPDKDSVPCRLMTPSRARTFYYHALQYWGAKRGGRHLIRVLYPHSDFRVLSQGPHCAELRSPAYFDGYDAVILFLSSACSWGKHLGKTLRRSGLVSVAMPLFHVGMDGYDWAFQKTIHARYDHIVTNTPYEKQFLQDKGWGADRLTPIGVGADVVAHSGDGPAFRKRYGIPAEVPVVLFLGRKNYHKGVTHLIEAMEYVWAKQPSVALVLVGFSQNAKKWLDDYLANSQYAAEKKTTDLYDVSEEDKEDALAAATMMVLPSINDSFGIAYLDAWRHRIPVVGCRHSFCEDVIDEGENGLLVEFGDIRAIGDAINTLLASPARCDAFGEHGYSKWRDGYTWPIMAGRMDALLGDLLA